MSYIESASEQLPLLTLNSELETAGRLAKAIACNFHYFRVSSLSSIMRRYNCARGGLTMKDSNLILVERIEKAIFFIRGEKVMLDSDLASLYGVETKAVNRAAKRNLKRFPSDFMFQLTAEESAALRYQIGTSKEGRGGRRYRPYAFGFRSGSVKK
jgi:ORF6N domain